MFQRSSLASSKICSGVLSKSLPKLIKAATPETLKQCFKEIKTGNEMMDSVLKQLVKILGAEMSENLARKLAGTTSPWQLLQIPAEIITYAICKLIGKDETFAYGTSKLASFATAAGVGLCMGGPGGSMISVIFWFAGEIVAWLIRKLFDYASSGGYSKRFGDSQTEALLKGIGINVKTLALGVWNYLTAIVKSEARWISSLAKAIENNPSVTI